MPFDLSKIPSTIDGASSLPLKGWYGRTSVLRYYDLQKQAQDQFCRTGDGTPLKKLGQAALRYTPEGNVTATATGASIGNKAVEDVIGYAQAHITQFDQDQDSALNLSEVNAQFLQPVQDYWKMLQKWTASAPTDPTEHAAFLNRRQQITEQLNQQTAQAEIDARNWFATVDIPDANGQTDAKITADELAAKMLFNDTTLWMYEQHQAHYQAGIATLQAAPDYQGPTFEELQGRVQAILSKPQSPAHPLTPDGQVTPAERAITHLLNEVPGITNRLVTHIHRTLDLKARTLQQLGPPREPDQLLLPPLHETDQYPRVKIELPETKNRNAPVSVSAEKTRDSRRNSPQSVTAMSKRVKQMTDTPVGIASPARQETEWFTAACSPETAPYPLEEDADCARAFTLCLTDCCPDFDL